MSSWQEQEAVDFMLDECETWAFVGLSGEQGYPTLADVRMVVDTCPAIEWGKR